MNDLRINILKYHKKRGTSTDEHSSNQWLEKQNTDLGAIRRALIELITDDFLIISNATKEKSIEQINKTFDTTTHTNPLSEKDKLKKSSKRLIEDVSDFKKIPEYKFMTTVKGLRFLIDFNKLNIDATMSKWQKIVFWPLLIISTVLAITQGIILFDDNNKIENQKQETEVSKNNQISFLQIKNVP